MKMENDSRNTISGVTGLGAAGAGAYALKNHLATKNVVRKATAKGLGIGASLGAAAGGNVAYQADRLVSGIGTAVLSPFLAPLALSEKGKASVHELFASMNKVNKGLVAGGAGIGAVPTGAVGAGIGNYLGHRTVKKLLRKRNAALAIAALLAGTGLAAQANKK